MKKPVLIAALMSAGFVAFVGTHAATPIAGGSTTATVSVTEATQLATGWSAKKSVLGKSVYNEAGTKIGKIEDLIIAPDKNLSYVIVGAGGFIGMGRHDVAIPVNQIQQQSGKFVMAGATKDSLKAMPTFTYATDTTQRDQFVAKAEQDIAMGKTKLAEMEKSASTAAAEAKVKMDQDVVALKQDVKAAETQLAKLKAGAMERWHEFEAGVNAATARVRKSFEAA